MNNILKSALAGSMLLFAGTVAQAQITGNVSVSGNLNGNAGASNFSGFPLNGTYHVDVVNQGMMQVTAGVLTVNLVLPPALEFLATYPSAPAGWTYTRINLQTARLVNTTDPIEVLPAGTAILAFDVPIKTVGPTTGVATFGWGVSPTTPDVYGGFHDWQFPPGLSNTSSGFTTVLNATPLNIQFKEFIAKADANCAVNLTWKTVAERNTEKFQVERSNDGSAYKVIGEVKSAATSQEVNEYSFVDRTPANNQNLYRIRQIITGGKPTVSNVENVKMQCQGDVISVYPNPTEGIVYVKGLSDKGTVRIFNAVGQLVLEKEVQNSVEGVNMNGLANGFYQVHVMKGEESVFSTKLIKK